MAEALIDEGGLQAGAPTTTSATQPPKGARVVKQSEKGAIIAEIYDLAPHMIYAKIHRDSSARDIIQDLNKILRLLKVPTTKVDARNIMWYGTALKKPRVCKTRNRSNSARDGRRPTEEELRKLFPMLEVE